ncbi:hypothetical protein [Salmonella enterica]|uniref:hypothetical protein n=1 Tax=Salmonella enterica TaxID=28901 RepID=UPI001CBE8BA5|nr:hypothetical protein [Salmonella enterica]
MAGAVAENILLIKVATPVNLLTNQPMAEFSAPLHGGRFSAAALLRRLASLRPVFIFYRPVVGCSHPEVEPACCLSSRL